MKQIETFSCEDGHIESIVIGAEQAKVSFRTWEGRGLVMIFEGVEKIISSHSVYGDIGAFCIAESNNGFTKELNYIAWDGREPVYDIRTWTEDHSRYGKGVTLTQNEMECLRKILSETEDGRMLWRNA